MAAGADVSVVVGEGSDLELVGVLGALEAAGARVGGVADNLEELLGSVERLRPEVVVVDDRLQPELLCAELVSCVKERALPYGKVVVLSSERRGFWVVDALAAGADAYLYRGDRLRNLLGEALEVVVEGARFISPGAEVGYLSVTSQHGGCGV